MLTALRLEPADSLAAALARLGAFARARFGGRLRAVMSGGARLEPEVGRFFQGLGMVVMRTLTDAALACGVAEGVLVATPDGAALYRRLQWRDYADYTSAVITDDVRS